MAFADADVAVRIDDRAQDPRPAGDDLRLRRRRPALGPLQQRLNARTVAPVLPGAPESLDVVVEILVRLELRALQRRVLAVPPDHGQIVMVHLRAALEQVGGQAANLVHVDVRCRRGGVDPQARIALLEFDQGVVGLDRFGEATALAAEPIVKLGHAVERMLYDEEVEALLLEDLADVPYRPLRERAVGGHVNLADTVVPDELLANLGEFRPEERLAPREVEVLDPAERSGQPDDLVQREVILAVQVAPVEAVLALLIADRIDKEDEERRRRRPSVVLQSDSRVSDDS